MEYLGCILDYSVSGNSMAVSLIDKVNLRQKFLHRQNRFLTIPCIDFYLMHRFNLFFIMLEKLGFLISQKD